MLALLLSLVGGVDAAPPPPTRVTPVADTGPCDRGTVTSLWLGGGPLIKAAAEKVLLGTDAEVCAFLATGWQQAATVDQRVAVNQIVASGGPAVRTAAQAALDSTAQGALTEFLHGGWQQPAFIDKRVHVNQMMAAGGPQLRAAGQKALDSTDSSAISTFLNTGWSQPYAIDQRLRVNQIMAAGGAAVKIAAQRALDAANIDAYARFIQIDWPVAAERDAETAQVAQLVQTAVDAAAVADRETTAAADEAGKAKLAAGLAHQSALDAAALADLAGADVQAATTAAQRAADAANRAADAAKQAISAAKAASAAAQVASRAAARASSAAAQASKAASNAWMYSASTTLDGSWAAAARAAAEYSRDLAAKARTAADAAGQAGSAARNASSAASAADQAARDSNAAANEATNAANKAKAAGNAAAQANAAARRAADNAARASRAAAAAIAYANTAADEAFNARDAANRAADHAVAAAVAAEDAIAHAADAAGAAARATEHANAAVAAAQDSIAAARQAQDIYDKARAAEETQRTVAFDQDDASARHTATLALQRPAGAGWAATQAAKRTAETNRLIAEATDVATPQGQAVADARQVAIALSRSDGEWTRAAALDALKGDDLAALKYVQHGVTSAASADDRVLLGGLVLGAGGGMQNAAVTALNGSDADVSAFLTTGDYPNRVVDDRAAVEQVRIAAAAAGNTVVAQRAQTALNDGRDVTLRAFLDTGQYDAETVDERVKVNQVLADPNTGPLLHNAAQVALDGPPQFLDEFLRSGQFRAAQQDLDSASHNATVLALLAQAAEAANTALSNAFKAQQSAADARGASTDANNYAQQATASANQAATFAAQANQAANQAAASAAAAAASANAARAAAQRAATSAHQAARSAVWAFSSARQAGSSANDAGAAANAAHAKAVAAGADAEAAAAAAQQARDSFINKAVSEYQDWVGVQKVNCQSKLFAEDCERNLNQETKDPILYAYNNANACGVLYRPGAGYDQCVRNAFSPSFGEDQALTIVTALIQEATGFEAMNAALLTTLATMLLCVGVCAALLEAATPLLMPELIGLPTLAGGATDAVVGGAAGLRTLTFLEEAAVEVRAEEAALMDLFEELGLGSCLPNSFVAGTRVLVPGGSRAIEDLHPGDRVLSSEPRGELDAETVTAVYTGAHEAAVDVTVAAAGGPATITATANHPFWVADPGAWVPAAGLRAGQWLRTSSGTWAQITAVRPVRAEGTVHNLTVAEHHTYYVLAGDTPVLVHNVPCGSEHVDIALGVNKNRDNALVKWADSHGYYTFIQEPYVGAEDVAEKLIWGPAVERAIWDPSKTFHVQIQFFAMDDGKAAAQDLDYFLKAALFGGKNTIYGNGTEWEMAMIARACYQDGRSWDSVRFYRGDQRLDFGPEPDWWNLDVTKYMHPLDAKNPKLVTEWQNKWRRYLESPAFPPK